MGLLRWRDELICCATPQLEGSNCPSVRKTHKRGLLELESFPEIGLYLVRSVLMRSFNFSEKFFVGFEPSPQGVKNGSKITL